MIQLISDKDLANFFKDTPLYSKTTFIEGQPSSYEFEILDFFVEKAYKFYCPNEKDYHTFKIPASYGQVYVFYEKALHIFLDKFGKVNFTFHLKGFCQSCGYEMNFLLNAFSEDKFEMGNQTLPTIYLKKVGQVPPYERNPEKEILDYLTEEDRENYRKALSNLAVSFGIGAYAYFRRIIENEIIRIVKDISQLDFEHADKVKQAWTDYEKNHQMTNLIENVYEYLPKSLKELGDNPIKLLHQQLSEGIHKFSESECLERAKKIDILLRFVIKKINSEKFEINEVKNAMKGLRSKS